MTYVRANMSFEFIVGAVMKNNPSNTHFKPQFIANCLALNPLWKRNGEDRINSWMDSFSYSFIRVEPGTDLTKVSETLQQIFNENLGEFAKTDTRYSFHFAIFILRRDSCSNWMCPGRKHIFIFSDRSAC